MFLVKIIIVLGLHQWIAYWNLELVRKVSAFLIFGLYLNVSYGKKLFVSLCGKVAVRRNIAFMEYSRETQFDSFFFLSLLIPVEIYLPISRLCELIFCCIINIGSLPYFACSLFLCLVMLGVPSGVIIFFSLYRYKAAIKVDPFCYEVKWLFVEFRFWFIYFCCYKLIFIKVEGILKDSTDLCVVPSGTDDLVADGKSLIFLYLRNNHNRFFPFCVNFFFLTFNPLIKIVMHFPHEYPSYAKSSWFSIVIIPFFFCVSGSGMSDQQLHANMWRRW